MKNNILVTGALGFIGINLCEELLKAEHNYIYAVDNLIIYDYKYDEVKDIIDRFYKTNRFKFIEWDITKPIDFKVNQIYNLACPASPKNYKKYPLETILTSTQGLLNILNLTLKYKAKLIHFSTSEVYGDPIVHPQSESYWGNVNCVGERSCYDEGKRCGETLCYIYNQKYNLDITVLRLFNIYGEHMAVDDGRVIPNFMNQIFNNKPLTIYGDGTQTRSFCYIKDVIPLFINCMNSNKIGFGPYNVGNPNEVSINDLANIFKQLLNYDIPVSYEGYLPQDDPSMRKPDIEKITKLIEWSPTTDLKEGLKNTLKYYKEKFQK